METVFYPNESLEIFELKEFFLKNIDKFNEVLITIFSKKNISLEIISFIFDFIKRNSCNQLLFDKNSPNNPLKILLLNKNINLQILIFIFKKLNFYLLDSLHLIFENLFLKFDIISFYTYLFIKNYESLNTYILGSGTPLMILCRNENITYEILSFFIDILIKHNYNILLKDEYKFSALSYLSSNESCTLKMLLKFAEFYQKISFIDEIGNLYFTYKYNIDYFYD